MRLAVHSMPDMLAVCDLRVQKMSVVAGDVR